MGSIILGLLAESSLHPGGDVSSGVVDLPVARESTTSYPVLRGSGLKGALRDIFENRRNSGIVERIFGKPDGAGGVSVTDGRLLLLPVRSLTSNYYWVTCPYILERLQRDLQLVGFKKELPIPAIGVEEAILLAEDKNADRVYLEELSFTVSKNEEIIKGLAEVILPLILHDTTKARLVKQLAIINDDDLSILPVMDCLSMHVIFWKKRRKSVKIYGMKRLFRLIPFSIHYFFHVMVGKKI